MPAPFGAQEAVDLARLHGRVDAVDGHQATLELPSQPCVARAGRTRAQSTDRIDGAPVVLNGPVKLRLPRTIVAAAGVALAALAAAPSAQATITWLGPSGDAAATLPSCPTDCIAVTRTTGYQAKVAGTRELFVVPRKGRIVAWQITLGNPGERQREFFADNFGGAARAAISVLQPVGERKRDVQRRTVASSPYVRLGPYFGSTVEFPLLKALRVKKGQIVALSVPSWAPALSVGQPSETSWRASRSENCTDQATTQLQTVQQVGDEAMYKCHYRTARLTYRALLISTVPRPTAEGPAETAPTEGEGPE